MPYTGQRIESQPVNFSPLDKITDVLLGPPGSEATLALLIPPLISLFESNAPGNTSMVKAREDHERMQKALSENDIRVFNMRAVIGQELADILPLQLRDPEFLLRELQSRAARLHEIYNLGDLQQAQEEIQLLLESDIQTMGVEAAVAINAALNNVMDLEGNFMPFDPTKPSAANSMFWRDTNHVAPRGIATHRMFWPIREQEVALAEIGFTALGLHYKRVVTNGKGTIEGGDVLSMGLDKQRFALIGQAERTSWEAVEAWYTLHEASFSPTGDGVIPILVKGPSSNTQDQMHVDTFASQVAMGAVIHCGKITEQREVSILMRRHGEIVRVPTGSKHFAQWLDRRSDTFDMTEESQLNYAPNVLVDGSDDDETTVFITRDGNDEVTAFIRKHAKKIVELRMNEITKAYGGAHCLTSEIRKKRKFEKVK